MMKNLVYGLLFSGLISGCVGHKNNFGEFDRTKFEKELLFRKLVCLKLEGPDEKEYVFSGYDFNGNKKPDLFAYFEVIDMKRQNSDSVKARVKNKAYILEEDIYENGNGNRILIDSDHDGIFDEEIKSDEIKKYYDSLKKIEV